MERVGAGSPLSSSTLPSVARLKVRATCSAISRCPGRLRNPSVALTTASNDCRAAWAHSVEDITTCFEG